MGRPRGSKNKPKGKLGRPKGSKNKATDPAPALTQKKVDFQRGKGSIDKIKIPSDIFDFDLLSGPAQTKLNKKLLLKSIISYYGNITRGIDAIGLTRATHYYYMNNDPYYAKYFNEIDEMILDYVEEKSRDISLSGDKDMIKFMLKTKGKDRGYTERTETEVRNITPVTIQIVAPEPGEYGSLDKLAEESEVDPFTIEDITDESED